MDGIGNGGRGGSGTGSCAACQAPLAADQRFCVECGARRSTMPAAVAAVVARFASPPPQAPPPVAPKSSLFGAVNWIPSPRAAAVAVMAMLALGVVIGSVGQKIAQSAGLQRIVVEVPPAESPAPVEEEVEEEPEEEEAPVEEAPVEEEAPPVEEEAPAEETPSEPSPEDDPELPPEEPALPPVNHVFVIVLGENSYEETFGETATAPYLSEQLPAAGQLLPNYYAVTGGDLANQVALLSGQGPTPETAANCPTYADLSPGTISAAGQAEGSGCVYPAAVETLPAQLVDKKLTWKAYVGDIGNNPAEAPTCRHPLLGAADPRQAPVAGDAYVTWRNPFVYFHSILDTPECAERDVGLDQLAVDLEAEETTPTLSYIVPNACQDGGPVPCEPGAAAGPLETEALLSTVVPQIIASQAYKDGGLIAITSSQAQQGGAAPDASACCVFPDYPNVALAPEEPIVESTRASGGGGRVGLLLISPYVEPGTVNDAYYNHFSLLRSISELFEIGPLGYAAEPALTGFDSDVYGLAPTAEEEEWLLPRPRRLSR